MRLCYLATAWFVLMITSLACAGEGASDQTLADWDHGVTYPRLLAFRVGEGLKTEAAFAPFAYYDFVHAGGKREWIRKYNPQAPAVVHWRLGFAIKPGLRERVDSPIWKLGQTLWPGHWLLYNGTKVTQDVAGTGDVTTIHVADTRVFQAPSESPKAFGPDDIQLYALDAGGQPVWEQSEQVTLVSIDSQAGTITVKRGQYQSKPLRFQPGRAVAAAHARTLFLFGPDPSTWRVNMMLHCPRSPAGLTGAQYTGKLLAQILSQTPGSDGAEFDVGEWNLYSATTTKYRSFDGDNDLKPDECFYRYPGLGVVNEHGLGQAVCVKTMRDAVGPKKIIQADDGMRAYRYLNGSEFESYTRRPYEASVKFDHLRYILSRAPFDPKVSYVMVKQPTDRYTDHPGRHWGNNWPRMGLTSALMAGAYSAYNSVEGRGNSQVPTGLGFGRFYLWDEYDGGKLHQKHYLGCPLGPATPLPGVTRDKSILAPLDRAQVRAGKGYDARAAMDSQQAVLRVEVRSQPLPATNGGVLVFLPAPAPLQTPPLSPFTVRGEVRAQTPYGRIDPALRGVPSSIGCDLTDVASRRTPHVMADEQWRSFSLTLFSGVSGDKVEGLWLWLGEEPGTFEFRRLELISGDGFVMTRRFEHGIALLNGSSGPVTFDLEKIDPERRYEAIDGTITPDVNNGKPVEGPMTIPAFDGRILLVRKR